MTLLIATIALSVAIPAIVIALILSRVARVRAAARPAGKSRFVITRRGGNWSAGDTTGTYFLGSSGDGSGGHGGHHGGHGCSGGGHSCSGGGSSCGGG